MVGYYKMVVESLSDKRTFGKTGVARPNGSWVCVCEKWIRQRKHCKEVRLYLMAFLERARRLVFCEG